VTMRAACYERTGPAREVLEVRDLPEPSPATGEVRVRVHVSGVNPTDWKSRSHGPREGAGRAHVEGVFEDEPSYCAERHGRTPLTYSSSVEALMIAP